MKRALVMTVALATGVAWADGHGGWRVAPKNATYEAECGTCHVAYPPALLPAGSWQRLMGGLTRHFGSDASLEPAVRDSLAIWLDANAGRRRTEVPPEDRLTKSSWFVREHREVGSATWKRASVKSASNCTACHEGAASGDFSEHAVHIPR